MHDSDPVRRLCAAVAVHRRPPAPEAGARDPLYRRMLAAVKSACAKAGLERAFLQERRPSPDERRPETGAVLLLVPSGMNEARVITDLVHGLDDALAEDTPGAAGPLRLVIAFDQGITWLTERGFEGRVLTEVYRLCTGDTTCAALRGGPDQGVGVVISAALLDDLTPPPPGPGPGRVARNDLAPAGFDPLPAEIAERRIAAWSHPPGRRLRLPGQN
ncbi:hypothetical protein AGRA3207_002015 [Actinomadura graeca]|uniref:Uncharacterized protein n=1 Tax=Actinomadura graeca TaxID=2750812 RepID=A0ABX8QQW7_9ACTN|nr:hypothetical protein [Actinomadura graeca]QXJ21185.1 hypothetical protein AGRA3207_002015 [Actinomadura graeca]